MTDIPTLRFVTLILSRYTPMPIFVLGLIGNIFNILVFTRRTLFKNPCALYLFSGTLMNMSVLFFGLLLRLLTNGYDIEVMENNLIFCRLRYMILHPCSILSSWFLVLASIDRFCISSRHVRLRNFSKLSIARRTVIVTSCLCFLLYSHILGLFEIQQLRTGPYCYARVGTYRVFYDFLFFATFSFIPPILMIIIGLATIRNIRLVRIRILATITDVGQLNRKDRQLIVMLLIQLIATIICTLPNAILKLHSTFTINDIKSLRRLTIENLITQITRQLIYINSSIGFYLYIASSSNTFRHEFIEIIKKMTQCVFGRNNNRRIQHNIPLHARKNHLITVEQAVVTTPRAYDF